MYERKKTDYAIFAKMIVDSKNLQKSGVLRVFLSPILWVRGALDEGEKKNTDYFEIIIFFTRNSTMAEEGRSEQEYAGFKRKLWICAG